MSAVGWGQQRREPTPPYAYQEHDQDATYGNPAVDRNLKREKRRRDMVERVSRLHEDTVARRDRVFHDLSEIFARTADELLPPPVFPTFDLSIPVGQLPPSLPFTDPVIPDMHPTPYLFSLHRLSLQRANNLLAIRLFHMHQVAVARRLCEAERERVEEEYENAAKGVVERLLEGVEERRRRLTEEKEGDGVSLDSLLGEPSRSHGTRRMRGGPSRMHASRPHLSGNGTSLEDPDLAPPNGTNGGHTSGSPAPESSLLPNGSSNPSWATGGSTTDPFNIAATFLPSGNATNTHPLLSSLAGTSSGSGGILSGVGKRKPGPRAQPGLPPAHYSVTSGTYAQFGKSLAGLSGLRGEEVEGDLGEVRRKRARNAGGGGRGRRGVE
ncbi:hypothetical protein BCR35DRAFT_353699 [Leucosporidium creatinivorum]|uniref:Sds3-like-domain-containing protein n=1 Tax=Leucosporidium creatinivorum TaxID=106004 RepID=A0A1Y2ETW2_9BASI|nr:hypothetical protein BCR35DRAFT_353699 [Leucosporidium creatinivorum]